jgi:hypothetical protein
MKTMENQANNRNDVGAAPLHSNGRAAYEIRVRDHLDPHWEQWFEGWSLTNLGNGEVLLIRAGVDQSALHGLLNKVRNLNLTLLSVTRKEGG